jgi:hypothetical protein
MSVKCTGHFWTAPYHRGEKRSALPLELQGRPLRVSFDFSAKLPSHYDGLLSLPTPPALRWFAWVQFRIFLRGFHQAAFQNTALAMSVLLPAVGRRVDFHHTHR